jgi:hypothetical protein
MQTSRYLVSNRINILANEAGYVTEYTPVYQRNIKVYKGITNNLEFRLKNADQKPVALNAYTIYFRAFDENQQQVLEYNSNSVDIIKNALTGLFTVRLRENDLLNIQQQYLSYVIYLQDSNDTAMITYSDEWFGARGTIYVDGSAMPGPSPTYSVTTFVVDTRRVGIDDSVWNSEPLNAQPAINGNEALHTAVIYSNEYQGRVRVQATLDNQLVGEQNVDWTDVATVDIDNATEPTPVNFYGVFSFVRFVAEADPSNKISKILVRN